MVGIPFTPSKVNGTLVPIYNSDDWKPTVAARRSPDSGPDVNLLVVDLDVNGNYISKFPIDFSPWFRFIHAISWDGWRIVGAPAGSKLLVPVWERVSDQIWGLSLYGCANPAAPSGTALHERAAGALPEAYRYRFTVTGRPIADAS